MNRPARVITPELRAAVAEIEGRKVLTVRQAVHLAVQQRGLCGCGCGEPIDALGEGFIDEHVIPLALTGSNDLENRALLRRPCALEKTKGDVSRIAKAKRQSRAVGPREPPEHPIPQRADPWPPKGSVKIRGRNTFRRRNP